MGRTSVELSRFPHRNCKKNKKWMSTRVFQTRRWNIFIKKFWSLTTCSHCTSSLWMCLITTYRPVRSTLVTAGNTIRICMLLLTGKLSLFLLPAKMDPKSPPLTISSFVYLASKWATHAKIHVLHTWTLDNVEIKGFSFCQLYHKAGNGQIFTTRNTPFGLFKGERFCRRKLNRPSVGVKYYK